jgi:hypothetical protein
MNIRYLCFGVLCSFVAFSAQAEEFTNAIAACLQRFGFTSSAMSRFYIFGPFREAPEFNLLIGLFKIRISRSTSFR